VFLILPDELSQPMENIAEITILLLSAHKDLDLFQQSLLWTFLFEELLCPVDVVICLLFADRT